jgi:DNA polymerase I-like protein with 3'-5' exonuclease and polymerase domains
VTFNDKGEPTGDNYQLYSKLFSSYANMMANATVQNWEAYLVMSSINEIQDWLKSTNKKSFIFNTVHDSIDMAIEKTELKEVCEKVSEICSRPRKNSFGMPQKVDITISDLTQGQYYKAGKDWKNFL